MSQLSPAAGQRSCCRSVCDCVCVREREKGAQRPCFEMFVRLNCENHSEVIVICNPASVSNLLSVTSWRGCECYQDSRCIENERSTSSLFVILTLTGGGSDVMVGDEVRKGKEWLWWICPHV